MPSTPHRLRFTGLLLGLALVGVTAGCGSSTKADTTTSGTSTTTSTTSATTTTPVGTETTSPPPTTLAAEPTTTDDGNPVHGDAVDAPESSWTATAQAFAQRPRTRVRFTCPPGGTLAPIWGTGTYSDASPVCVAAVHAGLISTDTGGTVIIQVTGPQDAFTGSTAHGVTSGDAGSASGSFVFPES